MLKDVKAEVLKDLEAEAYYEDHFHAHVSIHLGPVGVEVEASIQPDDLEEVTVQMLSFARQIAEDLVATGEVQGSLTYDWDKDRYSDVSLKSESGLSSELPQGRGPLL